MGRPWWYDSYWRKNKRKSRGKRFIPRGPLFSWLILLLLALLVTFWRTFR